MLFENLPCIKVQCYCKVTKIMIITETLYKQCIRVNFTLCVWMRGWETVCVCGDNFGYETRLSRAGCCFGYCTQGFNHASMALS